MSVENWWQAFRDYSADYSEWFNAPHSLVMLNRSAKQDHDTRADNDKTIYSSRDFYNYYKKSLGYNLHGVTFDEYSANPVNLAYSANSFAAARELKCDYLETNYDKNHRLNIGYYTSKLTNFDGNKELLNNHDAFDFLVAEAYYNCDGTDNTSGRLERFVRGIKAAGIEEKSVIGLSLGRYTKQRTPQAISDGSSIIKDKCSVPTDAYLRQQIKDARKLAPWAPHFMFYQRYIPKHDVEKVLGMLRSELDDKSPSVSFENLSEGQSISGEYIIKTKGRPNSSTGELIREYRLFVDNLVYQVSDLSNMALDTSSFTKGNHVITVHAVDSKYLVGVSQVEVQFR